MATGDLKLRVRPIRIAFLVDPADLKGLCSAIEVSTFLWGGVYNPMIPVVRRTPDCWQPHRARGWWPKPAEIIAGYLEGFDPDLVVKAGAVSNREVDVGHRQTAALHEVIGDISDTRAPRIGIGLIEVLWDFLEKELKYQRADKLQLALPRIPDNFRAFLSSVFGTFTPETERRYREEIPQSAPLISPDVSLDNYAAFLEPHFIFPRRLCYWSLEDRPLHDPTLFLCDASSGLDVLDYWNLRAAGHHVIPIAVQSLDNESVMAMARKFIEENFRPYRGNPQIFHHTVIQKSRTIGMEHAQRFSDALRIPPLKDPHKFKYATRPWYPRIWDRWARDQAREQVRFAYSHDVDVPVDDVTRRLNLRSQDPHVGLSRLAYSGLPKFANELHFSFHGSKDPMAEVIPEGGSELAGAIGSLGFDNWRFSSSGPVFLSHGEKDLLFVDLPTAESVITGWLRERGWEPALSGPGRMALQLYRQMGGAWGITWLAHKGVIPLLGELEKEAGLAWPALVGKLQQIITAEKLHFTRERFLEGLIESNALRLGASVQCPTCTRHNWYELDKLRYELQCKFCLSTFTPPLKSPRDMQWTYRAHGPFMGEAAQGAFSVLLTLRFLSGRRTQGKITPLFSYRAKKQDVELESDLTCLYRSERGDSRTHVIHAECKSFGGFELRDFKRMNQLASEFPGAALIFSTLLDKLDAFSAAKLAALANQQRKHRLARKPYSPVIVLTATELFSIQSAPECWREAPFYDEVSRAQFDEPRLDVWADATQRLHLGLVPWQELWEQERKRRAQTRKVKVTPPKSHPPA